MPDDDNVFFKTHKLTTKQRQCLTLVGEYGMPAEDAGKILGIKVETVNFHLKGARDAYGARNTLHAFSMAKEAGEIPYLMSKKPSAKTCECGNCAE